ncbi:MAG: fatty acid--CoA ligase family protein [Bacillota bacterium]|uniref:Fatty acid--CoA ligase family protein n=1 Tax=Virgibacillus salarius TaxID=447199 RepID=A0A941DXI8_9BACI|nr:MULTISPECIES: fatty acid--CoA ligase family protein [Bacillaceae]MBR7797347.1 fatty acid--CoA ligase family protein [Virgibacillus salarius]NAZ10057.1 long-chain-fatty-acid--CoA ligase [Agaribacter marinus]MCC2250836.1 fatty acid--CoA ligase family protein [Virgibacillus sp. AGTR]MDY7046327.1 fatty acid--CoA ligase family protein [Virgibacillus sp. M23]QRZ16490.1 fatty acid--CoA ligase family protein [Virgibacillus sp. AGTR]
MNLSEQLAVTAKKYPDKTAYVFQHKETSYFELNHAVSLFASGLASLGYKKGDHVALVVGNSPYYVIGLYGALRLGLVIIPINPLYTSSEMTYIVKNGDVKAVITMDVLLEKFHAIDDQLPAINHYIVCDSEKNVSSPLFLQEKTKAFTEILALGETSFIDPSLDQEDLAIILYTSGTTGTPKGAMLSHKNLYSNAKDTADYLTINNQDRVIAALPMFHVFCLTVSLNAPLMNGGTVLILPKFSPTDVFQVSKQYQATIFAGVPTMYNYLVRSGKEMVDHFSTIRLCISGGASMPVALLKSFEEIFHVKVSEGYGLSEASPVTCFNPLDRPRKPGSIGRSILHVENKVVDEFGEEVQVGEVGELVVRGPNVMLGYYKMPEESAIALKDGWLYTGDMARMDDEGYFYIVDRKKDMILVGGYNVYPREVEEVLYAHPGVSEVAVIGVPDSQTGEAVCSFVVVNDSSITEDELLEYCATYLVKYKIPSTVEFLEELPKNTTGKILRKNLRSHTRN